MQPPVLSIWFLSKATKVCKKINERIWNRPHILVPPVKPVLVWNCWISQHSPVLTLTARHIAVCCTWGCTLNLSVKWRCYRKWQSFTNWFPAHWDLCWQSIDLFIGFDNLLLTNSMQKSWHPFAQEILPLPVLLLQIWMPWGWLFCGRIHPLPSTRVTLLVDLLGTLQCWVV